MMDLLIDFEMKMIYFEIAVVVVVVVIGYSKIIKFHFEYFG